MPAAAAAARAKARPKAEATPLAADGLSEKQKEDASYERFAFNEYKSSQLSLHRPIPVCAASR